jgi:hypothetical protein
MPLPRTSIGPAILTNVGDSFVDACRISAIVWEGATSSGDTVTLRHRITNEVLWSGRTNTTQTYQGINLGPHGEHAPNGFFLSQISAGRVLVYISQV